MKITLLLVNLSNLGHVEDESTSVNFLSKYPHRSHQFCSWNLYSHFPSRTTWSNRKIITVTVNKIIFLDNVLESRRRRHPCLTSLMCPAVRRALQSHAPQILQVICQPRSQGLSSLQEAYKRHTGNEVGQMFTRTS